MLQSLIVKRLLENQYITLSESVILLSPEHDNQSDKHPEAKVVALYTDTHIYHNTPEQEAG